MLMVMMPMTTMMMINMNKQNKTRMKTRQTTSLEVGKQKCRWLVFAVP